MCARHRHVVVRGTVSQLIATQVESLGAERVLCVLKDLTEKVLRVASQFILDNSPDVRSASDHRLHVSVISVDHWIILCFFTPFARHILLRMHLRAMPSIQRPNIHVQLQLHACT